jgi:hypothetical protein
MQGRSWAILDHTRGDCTMLTVFSARNHDTVCLVNGLMIADFRLLFEKPCSKPFNFAWRESLEGFGSTDFHRCCDGRVNALILARDTDGHTPGVFMPVQWKSHACSSSGKSNESMTPFLFALSREASYRARADGFGDTEQTRLLFDKIQLEIIPMGSLKFTWDYTTAIHRVRPTQPRLPRQQPNSPESHSPNPPINSNGSYSRTVGKV